MVAGENFISKPEFVSLPQIVQGENPLLDKEIVLPFPDDIVTFADLAYGAPLDLLTAVANYYDEDTLPPPALPIEAGGIIRALEQIIAGQSDAGVDFDPRTQAALKVDPLHVKLLGSRQNIRTDRDRSSGHSLSPGNTHGQSGQQRNRDEDLGPRIRCSQLRVFLEQVIIWKQNEAATVRS